MLLKETKMCTQYFTGSLHVKNIQYFMLNRDYILHVM